MARHHDPIENTADFLDSRDIIARIEYLADCKDLDPEEEGAELKALEALTEQCSDWPDWEHGMTLIHETHFTDYAEELAKDIHGSEGFDMWPLNTIDWDSAAEVLKIDYEEIEFDGEIYLTRG